MSESRTRLTRLRELGSTDRAALDRLLDDVRVGHFGIADDAGRPVVIPTAIARDGDRVLAHGSTGSRWMRGLAAGAPTCLAVTSLDGIAVARSAFESSLHYRSAVLFGQCTAVAGRTAEVRGPTVRELQATLVLALPIDEWSLKVFDGWTEDSEADLAGPAWAGVVPMVTSYTTPLPAPDLREGIDVPASVRRLSDQPR